MLFPDRIDENRLNKSSDRINYISAGRNKIRVFYLLNENTKNYVFVLYRLIQEIYRDIVLF